MSLRYRKLYWHHEDSEEPSLMLYEVKDDWVTRVVELWADGNISFADENTDTDLTSLPDQKWTEPKNDPEFYFVDLAPREFEAAWNAAQTGRH